MNGKKLDVVEAIELVVRVVKESIPSTMKVCLNGFFVEQEIHEKEFGSFYIIRAIWEKGEGFEDRFGTHKFGVFTNNNDLTSVFSFKECANNDKWREIMKKGCENVPS